MKTLIALLLIQFSIAWCVQAQSDTLVIPTFNYSQTHGGGIRDTVIQFPDDPNQSFEKIFMLYNMRCKDGLISVPGNTNRGCGEWDYSCNTYITDSSRTDSVLSYTNSHYISAFSGTTFDYTEAPLYDYYQYLQRDVQINAVLSESLHTVGSGNIPLGDVIATIRRSGKSQYLYSSQELSTAGVSAGPINGLLLQVVGGSAEAAYLLIRIKHTTKTELNNNDPDSSGFTEVFFRDYSLAAGANRFQFHTPFNWDGTSNILVEFSFTNHLGGNPIAIAGQNTGFSSGITAINGYSLQAVNGSIDLPTYAFSGITNEITVSFWSKGNKKILPVNNSIFNGIDNLNNRQLNVHLPWSNSSVYFDCGNNGSGSYDRIDKAATSTEYEGNWSHWAFTKNAATGDMKIYHNGSLWHSGTGKTFPMDIQKLVLGSYGTPELSYFGNFDEFRVWNKELSMETIQDWMFRHLDATHPDFDHLVANYTLDEGIGDIVLDHSPYAGYATINDFLYWTYERGSELARGFTETSQRPVLTFAQGDYELNITDLLVTDSVLLTPNIVRSYEIIPRYGTTLHDSIHEVSVNELWQAQYSHVYDPAGIAIDSSWNEATASITMEQLSYFSRYPAKYEIMSFVTPYGIYLDLGMEGKTWFFDVTDYAPILKGTKRMTIENGGQWQEDMDIKFMYITGIPPHDVLDINQIWRPQSSDYNSIINNRSFEPRSFRFHPDGARFKVRSVITGHGQEGEFIQRHHTLNINEGAVEFDWVLWKECSTIPIYPQGGTWIYDRAGWCPGTPSDLYEFDITDMVSPGQNHMIDYGLVTASGSSNYLVNNQLVSYGAPHFSRDAAVVRILKPNAADAQEERFNPACSNPEIVIKNNGTATLNSLNIEYFIDGGVHQNYTWNGSLGFLEQDTVVLPIPPLSFWLGINRKFTAIISNPNNLGDEYPNNNTISAEYDEIHVYPYQQLLTIQLKTNNMGYQTSYTLYKGDGEVYFERYDCGNNAVYNDSFFLPVGCYRLRINDTGGNGLEFWHQPNQGTGYFNILDGNNSLLYAFDPDFGGFAEFEFGIGNITDIKEFNNSFFLSVYPNPTSDQLTIKMKNLQSESISINLLSSVMTNILHQQVKSKHGELDTKLDLSQFPSGVYFLEISNGIHSQMKKIIRY